jgi:hypothetical protein
MTPLALRFKNVAAQVARSHGVRFQAYLEDWGLEQLLEDACVQGFDFRRLVSEAIFRLCITDGRMNNFTAGLYTIAQFIKEERRPQGVVWLQDLASMLKRGGCTLTSVEQWVFSHFP